MTTVRLATHGCETRGRCLDPFVARCNPVTRRAKNLVRCHLFVGKVSNRGQRTLLQA